MENQILKENPVLDKINTLKSRLFGADASDLSTVDQWTKDAKTALITANLQEHEAIKTIIDKVKSDVADIDDILKTAYSEDLTEGDRDRMLDVKKFYNWFLDLFTTAQSTISTIEENVDNELS